MRKDINKLFAQILKKYNDPSRGLVKEDYYVLKNILKRAENDKNFRLCINVKKIIDDLEKSDVLHKYAYKNYVYIRELPILPFPLSNEKIVDVKFHKENGIKLYCKKEDTSSKKLLSVYRNRIIDYTSPEKNKFNNIQYLQACEGITPDEAIELICAIYNCELPQNNSSKELITKYKNIIVSDKYNKILLDSKARAQANGDYEVLKNYYDNMFNIIECVKNDVTDKKFIYKEPCPVLVKK